jgi:diacylglycerol kinase (ATP)
LRVALMHNPTAGEGDHSEEGLTRTLESAGYTVVWRSSGGQRLAEALDDGIDLVVSAGGDGTARKVFKVVADTTVPATILPVGSANNIARAIGVPERDVAQLVRGWSRGYLRPYQLGLFSGPGSREPFVETVGGGVFAELIARAEESDEDPGGEEDVLRGLRMLREIVASAPALRWEIESDDEDLSADLLALEVTNVAETGPNVPLSPEAEPGDGHLDLVLIGPEHRDALVSYLDARLADRPAQPPSFVLQRGRRIVLSPHADCPLRLDDEVLGRGGDVQGATVETGGRLHVLIPDVA